MARTDASCSRHICLITTAIIGAGWMTDANGTIYRCIEASGHTFYVDQLSHNDTCIALDIKMPPTAQSQPYQTAPTVSAPTSFTPNVVAPPYNGGPPVAESGLAPPPISHAVPAPSLETNANALSSEPPCSIGINPFNPFARPPCQKRERSAAPQPELLQQPATPPVSTP